MYLVVPRTSRGWEHNRVFFTYSSMEQLVLQTAKCIVESGGSEDWCVVIGYDGVDEGHPAFMYWVESGCLYRDKFPNPSP